MNVTLTTLLVSIGEATIVLVIVGFIMYKLGWLQIEVEFDDKDKH